LPRPDGRLPLRQELQKLEADATSLLVRTSSSCAAALLPAREAADSMPLDAGAGSPGS